MVLRSNFTLEEAEIRAARYTLNSVHNILSKQTTLSSPHCAKALEYKLGELERSLKTVSDSCRVRKHKYIQLTQQNGYCVPGGGPRRAAQDNLMTLGRIIAEAQEMTDNLARVPARPVEAIWWDLGESSNSSSTSVSNTSK